MRVLILDDDDTILDIMPRIIGLCSGSYEVQCARTAAEARSILDSNVDLFILDGHCHASCETGMYAIAKGIRTVVCTGDGLYSREDFKEVIFKPFEISDLEKVLKKSS